MCRESNLSGLLEVVVNREDYLFCSARTASVRLPEESICGRVVEGAIGLVFAVRQSDTTLGCGL